MTSEIKSYKVLEFKYNGFLYPCTSQKEYNNSFNFSSWMSLKRALFLQYSN